MPTLEEVVQQIDEKIKDELSSCELNLEITADPRMNLGVDLYNAYNFIYNSDLSKLIKIVVVKVRITEELFYENYKSVIPDHSIQFHLKWEVI